MLCRKQLINRQVSKERPPCSHSPLHARDQFVSFSFDGLIFFGSPFHVVSIRLGMMSPAFLLEEIFDFGDVILHEHHSLISGCASLQ